jgi:5-methylcytosine-specific restriction endonuclease McrA
MKRHRLNCTEFQDLHRRVLQRDGWRCQFCGSRAELQVHHVRSRAQLGPDIEENLITLCYRCHGALHLHLLL